MRLSAVAVAAASVALFALPARSQTCANLGQAAPYNVFVLGDMSGGYCDVEGALAVGGDLALSNFSIGGDLPIPSQAATVGGDFNFIYGAIQGNASVGGTFTLYGAGFTNGGSLLPGPLPVDFDTAKTQLLALSAQLAALPNTGTTTNFYNVITMTGTDPALNVFTLDTDYIAQLNIDAPANSVVVINLPYGSRSLVNFGVFFSNPVHLIYNLPDATSLTMWAIDPYGTVLAPKAALQFADGVIDGQLIVASWIEGQWNWIGQANLAPFTCVPVSAPPTCTLQSNGELGPGCSGVVLVPADGEQGMLFFEDLWPTNGDLDFNDQVLTYNQQILLDANGNVTQLLATFNLLAVGATIHNGLYFHLPVPAHAASSIVLADNQGSAPVQLAPMPNEQELVLKLSPDTFDFFPGQSSYVNTLESLPSLPGAAFSVLITFAQPQPLDTSAAPYDIFISRSEGPAGHQIHLPQYAGTDAMDTSLFGTFDDRSTPGLHFVNEHGLPFALEIPYSIPWAQERVALERVYPNLVEFAESAAKSAPDWFETEVQLDLAYTHGAGNTDPPLPILSW